MFFLFSQGGEKCSLKKPISVYLTLGLKTTLKALGYRTKPVPASYCVPKRPKSPCGARKESSLTTLATVKKRKSSAASLAGQRRSPEQETLTHGGYGLRMGYLVRKVRIPLCSR